MIAIFLSYLRGRVWLLVAAAVILGGGYVYISILNADLETATLRATIAEAGQAEAKRVADANAKTISTIRNEAKREADALTAERDAALARATVYESLKGMIDHAPPSTACSPRNDDPVAPVLAHTLDGLRR